MSIDGNHSLKHVSNFDALRVFFSILARSNASNEVRLEVLRTLQDLASKRWNIVAVSVVGGVDSLFKILHDTPELMVRLSAQFTFTEC